MSDVKRIDSPSYRGNFEAPEHAAAAALRRRRRWIFLATLAVALPILIALLGAPWQVVKSGDLAGCYRSNENMRVLVCFDRSMLGVGGDNAWERAGR